VVDHYFIVTHGRGRLLLAGPHRGRFTRSRGNGSPPRHGGRVPQAPQSPPPPWPVRPLRPLTQACENSSFQGLISVRRAGRPKTSCRPGTGQAPWLFYRFPAANGMGLTGIVKVHLDTPPARGSAALCGLLLPGILGRLCPARRRKSERARLPGSAPVYPAVHDALARWASGELRSTNAQIEFLLRRALAQAGRPSGRAGPMRPARC
jgi:hypothetical protein